MKKNLETILINLGFEKVSEDGKSVLRLHKNFTKETDEYPNYFLIQIETDNTDIFTYVKWSAEYGSWDEKTFVGTNITDLFNDILEYFETINENENLTDELEAILYSLENENN